MTLTRCATCSPSICRVRRNNDELVATYGNLVNRVLTFVYKNFDGCVPNAMEMGFKDVDEINKAPPTPLAINTFAILKNMDEELAKCHFKFALHQAMRIAHDANRFLEITSPWKLIKEDRQAAARSLYQALEIINQLKTMLYPFLPFSSQKVHEYLGFTGSVEKAGWQWQELPPGQRLLKPQPLFTKLDEKLIEEETVRLGT